MILLTIENKLNSVLKDLDSLSTTCNLFDLECSSLNEARTLLLRFLEDLKSCLAYKMEQFDYYGVPLEEEDREAVQHLIEEVGQTSELTDYLMEE